MMLTSGTLLQDRYRIVRHIGGGGMGLVYLAEDVRLPGRQCAIKETSPAQLPPQDQTWAANAFRQEAQMLATLNHPGLTAVTDFFSEGGNLYLVMEYVPGQTLEQILADAPNGRLPSGQALNIVRQLCDVLTYLHQRNPPVIFRDLKPSNVMLTPEGQVKLIDFGIARFFKPAQSQDTVTLGTPGYAAPEQWGTGGQSDARSDVYGLGVLLLHLVTGYDPIPNPFPLPQPRQVMPDISPKVEHLILRATPMDPGSRYQSIAEFRHDMDTPSGRLLPPDKTSLLPQDQTITPVGVQPTGSALYAPPTTYPPSPTPYPQPDARPKRTGLWVGLGIAGTVLIALCAAVAGGAIMRYIQSVEETPTPPIPTVEVLATPAPTTETPNAPTPTAMIPPSPTTPPSPTSPPTFTPSPTEEPTPDRALRWDTVGQSVQGRDIDVATIGVTGGSAVVVVGSIQGDQSSTRDLINYLIDDFNQRQDRIPADVVFHFIPSINPDGNAASTRRNAHNVDLNRNWDTFDWTANPDQPEGVVTGAGGSRPHSEPETQGLAAYLSDLQRVNPNLRVVVWHTSYRLDNGEVYPGYTSDSIDTAALSLSRRYANQAGYTVKADWAPYETTGEMLAWCAEEGIEAIDVVIPRSVSASDRNLRNTTMDALLEVARFP
jgi:serine/threonine protein kinase